MRYTYNTIFACLLIAALLSSIGCGGKYPSVSGKITSNGEPVPMVRVVYTPSVVGDNHNPGPWSVGVTDQDGNYSLTTRHKETGASPGPHKVGFEWADIEFDTMSNLKTELSEAKGDAAKTAEINQSIADVKHKLKTRPKLRATLVFEFDVPAEGTTSANFELSE